MEFRVLDEPVIMPGYGITLLVSEGDCNAFADGCTIRDIRGHAHTVEQVTQQEGFTCLFIRNGDESYFGRLFRDIFVDATLFILEQGEQ